MLKDTFFYLISSDYLLLFFTYLKLIRSLNNYYCWKKYDINIYNQFYTHWYLEYFFRWHLLLHLCFSCCLYNVLSKLVKYRHDFGKLLRNNTLKGTVRIFVKDAHNGLWRHELWRRENERKRVISCLYYIII